MTSQPEHAAAENALLLRRIRELENQLAEAGAHLEELRQRDSSLRQSAERTADILESISDCFFTLDGEFRIGELNSRALEHFGLPREQVVGRTLWELAPHLLGTEIECDYRRALVERVTLQLETRSYFQPSHWFEVRMYPSHEGLSIFFRDITSRKQAETQLKESEQRLRSALESGRMVAWQYDLETRESQFSDTAAAVLGIGAEELTRNRGRGWRILHPDDMDGYRRIVADALRDCASYRTQFRVIRPDTGEEIWIEDTGRVVCDDDGKPSQIVGVLHDITDRRQAERELELARLAADSANRAKSEFVANMSHEIRTPMTAILGYADVLANHLQDPDNLQCVEIIRRNGRFLLEIINDILDLSKIEAGRLDLNRTSVAVQPLVHELIDLMRVRSEERRIMLHARFQGPLPEFISTDYKRLRQILVNLLGNAVKFTEVGGVQLVVSHRPETSQIVFEVVDTGIGISAELRQRLFSPFTQADASLARQYEGTGLGLSISRRLAEMLGGCIELESEVGRGSTFRLLLPVNGDGGLRLIEPEAAHQRETSVPPGRRRLTCCALVVDDRRDVRYIAQHFIEEAGGRVLTASNGKEAVDLLARSREQGPEIDIVIMDIQMPEMDGYAAARKMRADGYTRPLIALTANAMQGDRDKCLAAGYDDYTSKPIDGAVLVRLIHAYTVDGGDGA